MDLQNVVLGMNGLLLASLAFFIKQLIDKIGETANKLSSIDKSIAIIASEIKHLESKIIHFDKVEEKLDSEIIKVRERIHVLGNDINGIKMRCSMHHED